MLSTRCYARSTSLQADARFPGRCPNVLDVRWLRHQFPRQPTPSPQCRVAGSIPRCSRLCADWRILAFCCVHIGASGRSISTGSTCQTSSSETAPRSFTAVEEARTRLRSSGSRGSKSPCWSTSISTDIVPMHNRMHGSTPCLALFDFYDLGLLSSELGNVPDLLL